MNDKPLACVLVIEFDPLQRDLIELSLTRNRYQAVICDDLRDIKSLIKRHKPSVLLLDLYLPGMNSLDLLKKLQKEGLLKNRLTIALSAMGFPEIVQQAIQSGANDFLLKPFDTDALISRIQRSM